MFSSCNGVFVNSSSLFSSLPDADGSQTIPSEKFFYVKISDATYRGSQGHDLLDYSMYERENGPGYDCKVSKEEQNPTEDLYCMFDVLEADLFFHDIEFEYNVPRGMCDYLAFQTHWHFNQEAGTGPKRVFRETKRELKYCPASASSSGTGECPPECVSNRSLIVGTPVPVNCPVGVEYRLGEKIDYCYLSESTCKRGKDENGENSYYRIERRYTESKEELCVYNNTIEGEGENCCIGEYYLHDLDTQEKDPKKENWGGSIGQCIGGLGRVAWEEKSSDGRPIILVRNSINGLRDSYEIKSILGLLYSKVKLKNGEQIPVGTQYSLVTANYWVGIEDNTNIPGFYQSTHSPPRFHGSLPYNGYPYITWSCLDKAKEVRHRIHLIIREWNTRSEFEEFKSGGTGDPDISDKEGSECEYYEQDDDNIGPFVKNLLNNCNDMQDVDDWLATGEDHPELVYTE